MTTYLLTIEPYHDNSTPVWTTDDFDEATALVEWYKASGESYRGDATIWEWVDHPVPCMMPRYNRPAFIRNGVCDECRQPAIGNHDRSHFFREVDQETP